MITLLLSKALWFSILVFLTTTYYGTYHREEFEAVVKFPIERYKEIKEEGF